MLQRNKGVSPFTNTLHMHGAYEYHFVPQNFVDIQRDWTPIIILIILSKISLRGNIESNQIMSSGK